MLRCVIQSPSEILIEQIKNSIAIPAHGLYSPHILKFYRYGLTN